MGRPIFTTLGLLADEDAVPELHSVAASVESAPFLLYTRLSAIRIGHCVAERHPTGTRCIVIAYSAHDAARDELSNRTARQQRSTRCAPRHDGCRGCDLAPNAPSNSATEPIPVVCRAWADSTVHAGGGTALPFPPLICREWVDRELKPAHSHTEVRTARVSGCPRSDTTRAPVSQKAAIAEGIYDSAKNSTHSHKLAPLSLTDSRITLAPLPPSDPRD